MPFTRAKAHLARSDHPFAHTTLRWWGRLSWSGKVVALAYLGIALGLLFQPDRFAKTPAYHNLIAVLAAQAWGVLYLMAALGLLAGALVARRWRPAVSITAHTITVALTAWWLLAFVVRYATDVSTTIVNVISWAVFLALVLSSGAEVIDQAQAQIWAQGEKEQEPA